MNELDIINADKQAFFIYKNSSNVVSKQIISNAVVKGEYLQGFSTTKRAFRTYKIERIIKCYADASSLEHSELDVAGADVDVYIQQAEKLNIGLSLEICFSGFDKAKRDELAKVAKDAGLSVRAGVTAKLDFLCVGKPTGWKKIQNATDKGALILSETQFINFIDTGEIPYKSDDEDTDLVEYEKTDEEKLQDITEEVSLTFRTFREKRRSPALLANFIDGYAVGWRFAIKEAFKSALDIKLTQVTIDGHICEIWTQGTSYEFHRGDAFYSDRLGYDNWGEFLKLPHAVVLKVKEDIFSGYEMIASLDGEFTGDFLPARLIKPKKMNKIPVLFECHSYDSGKVTLEVSRPDIEKQKVVRVMDLQLTQDELISLLQTGRYWEKREKAKPLMRNIFQHECA